MIDVDRAMAHIGAELDALVTRRLDVELVLLIESGADAEEAEAFVALHHELAEEWTADALATLRAAVAADIAEHGPFARFVVSEPAPAR